MCAQKYKMKNYSVVSIKQTGCNQQTGWSKNFIQYIKKDQGGKKNHLAHERALGKSNLRKASKNLRNGQYSDFQI